MTEMAPLRLVALGALALAGSSRGVGNPPLPNVVANENRMPAGRLRHDTLTLQLEVRMARWRPEAPGDSGIVVAAFAEVGKPPQIPAPLIRVPAGTTINATIRNALTDSTITLYGFASHPATLRDTTVLLPGQSSQVRFAAGTPGTYLYAAVAGAHNPDKDDERETAMGALVIDPPGGSPPDRVFVINIWGRTIDSANYANALAINGRSWPYGERIQATTGDTLRWRWVNATSRPHPMHLHGFYYDIQGIGDGLGDTLYAPGSRRKVVTNTMWPFSTMTLSWIPERPGNWLFHCHIGFHVVPGAATLTPGDLTGHARMSGDARQHMAGLVMGISVRAASRWRAATTVEPERLRLVVQEAAPRGRAKRALGFVLQRGAPPAPDSIEIPGSMLLLTRGRPADILVVNRLRETAAIHWHGIELESFSDGVAGWSGAGRQVALSIEPGDSFTAHLTLPRAGTFMYHTHMNDLEQLTSGLYGPIVVLEPGQRFDPATDHVFIAGWDGTADPPHLLINGDSLPAPLLLRAGIAHRLRFISIGAATRPAFSIRQDTTLVSWRALAKDGADLPRSQATSRPSVQTIDVGEAFDFEWIPRPGEYRLVVGPVAQPIWQRRIVVR